ncbi:MAG: methyltransferase, TIGR04325 family [Opitutaceae bacterium]
MSALRRFFRRVVPRRLWTGLRQVWGWRWFRGEYRTWAEARAMAVGYDDQTIISKVLAATQAVRAGRAAFERDGVLFSTPSPDAPLLEALLWVRQRIGRPLRVLDFGGALGTSYWRHRGFLSDGGNWEWDIVEQPSFVVAGQAHLADPKLRFFETAAEAERVGPHDLVLCSGVLQYLEDPWALLAEWQRFGWRFQLFNNLPLHRRRPDRLRVQHVPPEIYRASYPVWFFNREQMLERMTRGYVVVREYESEAVWPVGLGSYASTGVLLERKFP